MDRRPSVSEPDGGSDAERPLLLPIWHSIFSSVSGSGAPNRCLVDGRRSGLWGEGLGNDPSYPAHSYLRPNRTVTTEVRRRAQELN